VVRGLALGGTAIVVLGSLAYVTLHPSQPELAMSLLYGSLGPGLSWLATAGIMTWGSRVGKLRLRDRVLNTLPWRGNELVLDAGCGTGLLLIGAAKHLTTGKAIGVDLWSSKDQAANRPEATQRNVALEGVADRVVLVTGDVRKLPFPDDCFDGILSSWVLHNIGSRQGRDQAVREIVRALKPGGRVVLLDIWYTGSYARVLRASGLVDVQHRLASFCFVTPTFVVVGRKPDSNGGGQRPP